MEDLTQNRYAKTVLGNNIVDSVNSQARFIRNILLVNGNAELVQEEYRKLMAEREKISQNLEILQKTIDTPEGEAILQRIISTRAPYAASISRIYELASSGRSDEAVAFLLTETRSHQAAFFSATAEIVSLQGKL